VSRRSWGLAAAGLWLVAAIAVATIAGAKPAINVGGHYSLEDLSGRSVTEASFRGKWQLIYFGFTSCPDICPTALHQVHAALDALGSEASNVQPLFVTLDPERDTPDRLAAYLAHFDPRIVGLRGDRGQTEAAVAAFRVFYRVRKAAHSDAYSIDHSSFLFLMKPDGSFARVLQAEDGGHELAGALRGELGQ
jgi:protein SCO1/2